jgi:hypothetical protein
VDEPAQDLADAPLANPVMSSATSGGAVTSPPQLPTQSQAFTWQISPDQSLVLAAGTTTTVATGAIGMNAQVSPDLPPGRTLAVTPAGDVNITAAPGAVALDVLRPSIITVTDSELATAQNMRTGQIYGFTQGGSRRNIQYAITEAADGDTIQISPGAIWSPGVGDGSAYLETACLHVWKSLTITSIPGQGRWRLAPRSIPFVAGHSGIVIREPSQTYSNPGDTNTSNPRKTIVIEGFDFDNWGVNGDDLGVKIRSNRSTGSWDDFHTSVTFHNFKVGKLPFYRSASGVGGSAENLTFFDGHVYDTGDGVGAAAGNDHNFYVSARNLVMRGVRSSRTRSSQYPFNQASTLDGHIMKLTFNHALIEGCVLDCSPEGDNSITLQAKGGGNLVVRGCLLISGKHSQTATGSIVFEKENNNFGGWSYGLEGHSVLVEKNVFINHRPYVAGYDERAMVYCRPPGHANQVDPAQISSFIIRDNVGISTVPSPLWIRNPPAAFADSSWNISNSALQYDVSESVFSQRELLQYRVAAGPIPGNALATQRFVFPHGYVARSDSSRGLG